MKEKVRKPKACQYILELLQLDIMRKEGKSWCRKSHRGWNCRKIWTD